MSRRVILRYHGSYSSDGRLRSGLVFSRICIDMLKLFSGNILILFTVNKLLRLCCGNFHGDDRRDCLLCVHRWFLLR